MCNEGLVFAHSDQVFLDQCGGNQTDSSELAFAFGGHVCIQVAFTGGSVKDLPGAGDPQSLLQTAVCLISFGHVNLRIDSDDLAGGRNARGRHNAPLMDPDPANDNIVPGDSMASGLQQLFKFFFRENDDAELLRFSEFASRFFAGDEVVRVF